MWKKTLTLWKLIVFDNPDFTLSVALLYFLLNFLFLVPILNIFNFFIESVVTFALLICVSKLYVAVEGNVRAFKEELSRLNAFRCVRTFWKEAVAVSLAHIVTGILSLFIIFLGLAIIALITGTSFIFFNFAMPAWAIVLYLVFLLFVYFSIVTSYPSYFARVIFEAQTPKDYFFKFITAPFSKLLLKMSFSLDLLFSSLIISFFSLLLTLFKIFVTYFFPISILFVSFFAFLNMLLVYLFGVVAVGEFVWKRKRN